MRRRRPLGVRVHLALATTALALVCVVLTSQLMHRTVQHELDGFTREAAAMSARHVAGEAAASYARGGGWSARDIAQIARLERVLHHSIAVMELDGSPVPGSPAVAPPDAERAPVLVGGQRVGTAMVAHWQGDVGYTTDGRRTSLAEAITDHLRAPLLEAGLLAALLAALAGVALALQLARPLTRLTHAAERLTRGELAEQPEAGGCREARTLASTLSRLGAALRRQDELRRATAADVAHELRNAMVGIVGRIEAVQDGIVPDERRALDAAQADGRRASRLIDDIQRLADAQRPALLLRKAPLELGALVEDRAAGFAPRFAERGIALERHTGRAVVGADAGRLAQVIDNLLSNALRYTDPGGRVVVRVRRAGDEALLEVADTGVGMAPQDLGRVFDRFVRLPGARERAADGSGVGLAIVQDLVTSHGGRVDVSSTLGAGSTFRVHLPAADVPAGGALEREGGPEGASEDEPAVWRLRGDIDAASAPAILEELLRALPEHAPQLVLDLSEVGFMDSAGLHVMVSVRREVHARGGGLAIVAGDAPQVRRLFDVVAVREPLPVVSSRDAALRRVHAAEPQPV